MCTAISFSPARHHFGRTLDLEYHYKEAVTITPRNFPFTFRHAGELSAHYSIIGMTTVVDNYPLYYDATNEKGLSAAGLNFPGNSVYFPCAEGADNIAPFEFIPWLLGQCADLAQVREKLSSLRLVDTPFNEHLPLTPLHWLISDSCGSVVVEQTADGLHIYDNPIGVLTNNPPFPYQLANLASYQNLTREEPVNRFCPHIHLDTYSRGMGAIGLPGDLSSASRFVRAAFVKLNSVCDFDEMSAVSQFFHILGAVEQQRGCARVGDDFEITVYTSCCSTDTGVYYYTTYGNRSISAVDMHRENLDGDQLISYPLETNQKVYWQN